MFVLYTFLTMVVSMDLRNCNNKENTSLIYKNIEYALYNLSGCSEISIICNGSKHTYANLIKTAHGKYVLFEDICVRCDNIKKLEITYHYYGYKWTPRFLNMNMPLHDVLIIEDTDFNDITENLTFNEKK